ncbi:MAG: hypothetical protein DLM70_14055 [Chloroflexi bacterium]|nr:MAG: hypothetical protein DLM70_14055 [Chloroflexota bacterium]
MGKPGQPDDRSAWEAKHQRAIKLLEMGYSQTVVARNLGASRTWVNRVYQEWRGQTGNSASG